VSTLRSLRESILDIEPEELEQRIRDARLDELPEMAGALDELRRVPPARDAYRALFRDERRS